MVKFFGKIFVGIILFASFSLTYGSAFEGDGDHCFYLYDDSSLAKTVRLDERSAKNFICFKSHLKGESIVFNDKEKAKRLIKEFSATLILCESGKDFYCEYFYSPKIKNFVFVNGKKVNLHFSYSKDNVKVGTPLIFDSF